MFEARRARIERELFEAAQYKKARTMLESIPSFARDQDEDQWTALSSGKKVYLESEIVTMQAQAMNMYYKNPMAKGIIETLVNFIVGRQMKIIALDEDPQVQAYWDKFYRVNKFDEKSKELVRRSFRDGEDFLRFFEPKGDEEVQSIRFVEPSEITDRGNRFSYGIQTDPDDVEKVENYYRKYNRPTAQSDITTTEQIEEIPAEEIIHTKIGVDSNVKRGVSFFVGIASYLTKYMNWLDDRILLNKIRTIHNFIIKVSGISPTDYANKFADTTVVPAGGTAKKKLPKSGSVLIGTPGIDYDFKNLQIRAQDTKDDGRAILLMIVVGTNLAEYMVTGSAANANYASTMVAESPAVKTFEAWQDFFEKVFKEIYRKVISYGIKEGKLPENSKKTTTTWDRKKEQDITKEDDVPTNRDCQVDFPILIHRNIKEETEALAIQSQSGWISSQTATGQLGLDYQEEQDQIAREMLQEKDSAQEKKAEFIKQEEE